MNATQIALVEQAAVIVELRAEIARLAAENQQLRDAPATEPRD